jgi:hypothetical protein
VGILKSPSSASISRTNSGATLSSIDLLAVDTKTNLLSEVPSESPKNSNNEDIIVPVDHLTMTEDWKLFKCVMAMKCLSGRLESVARGNAVGSSNNSSFSHSSDMSDLRKAYQKAFSLPGKANSFNNMALSPKIIHANIKSNLLSIKRILNSAYDCRERELLIYGNDLIVMAFFEILQEKFLEVIPM